MKRLLRSILDIQHSISQENLVFNFTKLRTAKLDWGRPDDEKVFNFADQFFSSNLEMPAIETVRDYFERNDDIEVIERLKDIEAAEFYIRTNFSYLLKQEQEQQAKLKAVALLKESHDILTRGIKTKGQEQPLIGLDSAYQHLIAGYRELLDASGRVKETHEIRSEAGEVWKEYEDARDHPERRFGSFSGLIELDESCGGVRPGELWVHGAYPGELKSTLALNWAYSAATQYRRNPIYISLEMPLEQLRKQAYAIHSANRKWPLHHNIHIGPLDYRKIRDGQLDPPEEAFFHRVVRDFEGNPNYCNFFVHRPVDGRTLPELQTEIELLDQRDEIGLVIIDQGQWVLAQKENRRENYTVELNSIVLDAKRLAMSFAKGRRVPVILLWQINRAGKDEAEKSDPEGEYKLKAFTYANEIEKTADVITTSYLSKSLRLANRVRISNLKNRDNPQFPTFDARVHWGSRRITSVLPVGASGSGMDMTGGELDNV